MYGYICIIKCLELSLYYRVRKVPFKNSYLTNPMIVLVTSPARLFVTPWTPPGSSVHGILQARILEWAAIPFSRVSFQPRGQTQVSCIAGRFFTIWDSRGAHKPEVKVSSLHILLGFQICMYVYTFKCIMWNILYTN